LCLRKRKSGKSKGKCNNFPPTKSYPRHISHFRNEQKEAKNSRIQRRGKENGPATAPVPALSPPPSTASPGSCADPGEPPSHSVAPAPFPSAPAPPPPSPRTPGTRARVKTRAQLGHSDTATHHHTEARNPQYLEAARCRCAPWRPPPPRRRWTSACRPVQILVPARVAKNALPTGSGSWSRSCARNHHHAVTSRSRSLRYSNRPIARSTSTTVLRTLCNGGSRA